MSADVTVQWMEAEPRSLSNEMNAYYKKLKVTAKKRYRSVKIKRPDRTLVCGLGDFVHLESGLDEAPYVARIVALYEEDNGRKPYAIVQWLYRDSDLVNPPSDVQKDELFFTVHNDPNTVDVITEVVRIGLAHPDGTTHVSHLYADDTGDETAPSSPRYQTSRVYEHTKHKIGYMSESFVESLERFNDSTANASLSLYSSLQQKKRPLQVSGTTVESESTQKSPIIDSTNIQEPVVVINERNNEEVVEETDDVIDRRAIRTTKRSRKSSGDTLDSDQKKQELPQENEVESVHLVNEVAMTPEPMEEKEESPEMIRLWNQTKLILTYVHTCSPSESGELHPSIVDAVNLADRLEHALKCRDTGCACGPDKMLLEHFVKAECKSNDCEECKQVLEAIKVHACRCQALSGLCQMPMCKEFKPSRWMAHALNCHSRECGQMLCSKMHTLVQHAFRCTLPKGETTCEQCRDYYLVIKLHSIGCANGLCHFPNCPHFHEVLEHLRRREPKCRNAVECLECFTFFKIQALHFESCTGEIGKCFFPRCEGKKQPVVTGRSSREMLRQLRVISKRQVPIGTDHQATIQPLLDRQKTSPEPTEIEKLWSPELAGESELLDKSNELFEEKLKVEPGAVFAVNAPDPVRPKERRYMLCRVLEAPDSDGVFLCTPFDVAWPRKKNTGLSIQEIPYPLLYRFHTSDIAIPENYLERAMHSYLTKPVEKYSYETTGNIVEKWSKSEYEDLCEVLLDAYKGSNRPGEAESDWLDDAIAVFGQSKPPKELTAFWYSLAKGVANSPPGSILCSKCQTEDVKHVCKQYFSCRTGLCPVCFLDVSRPPSGSKMRDEVESLLWFCDACVEGRPPASNNNAQCWHGCNLVTPDDGYDAAVAWRPRARTQGKVLREALLGLDQVLYQYSTESYERAIQVLLKYGGKSSSEEELERELVAIDEGEGRTTLRQLLGQFWPV